MKQNFVLIWLYFALAGFLVAKERKTELEMELLSVNKSDNQYICPNAIHAEILIRLKNTGVDSLYLNDTISVQFKINFGEIRTCMLLFNKLFLAPDSSITETYYFGYNDHNEMGIWGNSSFCYRCDHPTCFKSIYKSQNFKFNVKEPIDLRYKLEWRGIGSSVNGPSRSELNYYSINGQLEFKTYVCWKTTARWYITNAYGYKISTGQFDLNWGEQTVALFTEFLPAGRYTFICDLPDQYYTKTFTVY